MDGRPRATLKFDVYDIRRRVKFKFEEKDEYLSVLTSLQ